MTSSRLHTPGKDYYTHTRTELADWLAPVPEKVLEVGCGTGSTLYYLKQKGARVVFGIELDAQVAERARPRVDHLVVGDIEAMALPYEEGMFDGIILGDVLEHLRDPWRVLGRLVTFLREGGQVVASLPNVRFYGVSLGLVLAGRWEYQEEGILDRTHLRFFTRRSALALFEGAGLQVVDTASVYGPRRALFNRLTGGLFRDFLARQHLVKGVKRAG